jgi:hypothetical protein
MGDWIEKALRRKQKREELKQWIDKRWDELQSKLVWGEPGQPVDLSQMTREEQELYQTIGQIKHNVADLERTMQQLTNGPTMIREDDRGKKYKDFPTTSELARYLGRVGGKARSAKLDDFDKMYIAHQGGEARAKKLSPKRRKQIAKAAAKARWKKAVTAHRGKENQPENTTAELLKAVKEKITEQ